MFQTIHFPSKNIAISERAMCTSSVHIIFGVVLIAGFLLTVIAFATPGWSNLYLNNSTTTDKKAEDVVSFGLLGKLCPKNETAEGENLKTRCENAYEDLPFWMQAVLALMILSILGEIAAIVWSGIAFATCCCKQCLTWPLPIITGMVSFFILIAIIVYAANVGGEPGEIPKSVDALNSKSSIGYSMWLAIFAFVVMLADTIIGFVLVKVAAVSPL